MKDNSSAVALCFMLDLVPCSMVRVTALHTEVKMLADLKLFLCLALVPWVSGCERGGTPAQQVSQASPKPRSREGR